MTIAKATFLLEDKVIDDLKVVLKAGKACNDTTHQTMLAEVVRLTEDLKGLLVDPTLVPTTTTHVTPADNIEPWNGDEAVIVEWIRAKRGGNKDAKIRIVSGLESIRITSPQDFESETLNVHKKEGQNDWIYLKEKLSRAVANGSDFGWREFILCCENWQKIHSSWRSHWQYFAKALVKIDGVCHVAELDPSEHGCNVYFYLLDHKSNDVERFPVLASPRS